MVATGITMIDAVIANRPPIAADYCSGKTASGRNTTPTKTDNTYIMVPDDGKPGITKPKIMKRRRSQSVPKSQRTASAKVITRR